MWFTWYFLHFNFNKSVSYHCEDECIRLLLTEGALIIPRLLGNSMSRYTSVWDDFNFSFCFLKILIITRDAQTKTWILIFLNVTFCA